MRELDGMRIMGPLPDDLEGPLAPGTESKDGEVVVEACRPQHAHPLHHREACAVDY